MANKKVPGSFYSTIAQKAVSTAPVNLATVLRDRDLALSRASALLGYQTYLNQCRAWKAAQGTVPASFEREVQSHARQALADTRDLSASMLRLTRQMKQTGRLDQALAACVAGVRASGAVQAQDLWSDTADDENTRQLLRAQGISDELFGTIDTQMRGVQGRVLEHGGKLAFEVGPAGQASSPLVITPSATGDPRNVAELLRRGQFERVLDKVERGGAFAFAPIPGRPSEIELADLISSGALVGVQSLAQHVRKLEDSGLAAYAGNDPATIFLIVAGLFIVAADTLGLTCDNRDTCSMAIVLLLFAGLLLYAAARSGLLGSPVGLAIGGTLIIATVAAFLRAADEANKPLFPTA